MKNFEKLDQDQDLLICDRRLQRASYLDRQKDSFQDIGVCKKLLILLIDSSFFKS